MEDVDTYYVELGEKVYIQCVKDGSHRAEGIVTGVSGSSYTVTTTAGEMYLQESAYIYRSPDYDADSCLGTRRGASGRRRWPSAVRAAF